MCSATFIFAANDIYFCRDFSPHTDFRGAKVPSKKDADFAPYTGQRKAGSDPAFCYLEDFTRAILSRLMA